MLSTYAGSCFNILGQNLGNSGADQGHNAGLVGSMLSRRELFEAGFDLRREVCAEMVRRREDIEPFIPGVFDAYVSNMSLEGIWGGNSIMCLWERTSP